MLRITSIFKCKYLIHLFIITGSWFFTFYEKLWYDVLVASLAIALVAAPAFFFVHVTASEIIDTLQLFYISFITNKYLQLSHALEIAFKPFLYSATNFMHG